MKFEDRSHVETGRQQRCARSKAWNFAKQHIQAQRKRQKLHSTRPRKNGYSRLRQQKSRSSCACGQQERPKELDLFVTVMLLEETPAVLSLGKLCEDHGYTYHWNSGRKPQLTKKGKNIDCNISNNVPFVVPGLSTSASTTPTPTSSSSSSQDPVFDFGRYTRNPVPERSGSTSEEQR